MTILSLLVPVLVLVLVQVLVLVLVLLLVLLLLLLLVLVLVLVLLLLLVRYVTHFGGALPLPGRAVGPLRRRRLGRRGRGRAATRLRVVLCELDGRDLLVLVRRVRDRVRGVLLRCGQHGVAERRQVCAAAEQRDPAPPRI